MSCLRQETEAEYAAALAAEAHRIGVACASTPAAIFHASCRAATRPLWVCVPRPHITDAFGLVAIVAVCVGLLLGVVLAALIHRRLHPHRYRKRETPSVPRRAPLPFINILDPASLSTASSELHTLSRHDYSRHPTPFPY